jgi:hypothetical protein
MATYSERRPGSAFSKSGWCWRSAQGSGIDLYRVPPTLNQRLPPTHDGDDRQDEQQRDADVRGRFVREAIGDVCERSGREPLLCGRHDEAQQVGHVDPGRLNDTLGAMGAEGGDPERAGRQHQCDRAGRRRRAEEEGHPVANASTGVHCTDDHRDDRDHCAEQKQLVRDEQLSRAGCAEERTQGKRVSPLADDHLVEEVHEQRGKEAPHQAQVSGTVSDEERREPVRKPAGQRCRSPARVAAYHQIGDERRDERPEHQREIRSEHRSRDERHR